MWYPPNNWTQEEEFALVACRIIQDAKDWEKFVRLFESLGEARVFSFSKAQQIETMVAHNLIDIFGEATISDQWKVAHQQWQQRITSYMAELDKVAKILDMNGIPLIALKNGGIARGIFSCLGCCPMGDLDVLIEKKYFRKAHALLLENQYHFKFRSPLEQEDLNEAEKGGGGEYWTMLDNGEKLWFELQWRPIAGRWIRPDQEPKSEELMKRSLPVYNSKVRILSPEDNLLQVALHTAKHTFVRAPGFRLHLDVERIVQSQQIDWELFLSRTKELQVATPVFFSLWLPKIFFATPIPESVLESLAPKKWKLKLIFTWLRRVGLFYPDRKKFSNIGFILFSALMYDDIAGLIKAILPESDWMKKRYGFEASWKLPYYHLLRLAQLVFKRVLK